MPTGNLSYLFSVDPDHVKCTQQNQSRCWLAQFTSSVVLKINLCVHNYAALELGATEVNGSSSVDFNRHRTTATFSGDAIGACTKLKATWQTLTFVHVCRCPFVCSDEAFSRCKTSRCTVLCRHVLLQMRGPKFPKR